MKFTTLEEHIVPRPKQEGLTPRENQIMDVIWNVGDATVEDIQAKLDDDLAGSTIRTLLGIMQNKGYVDFYKQGKAKVFRALVPKVEAQTSALQTLIQRLFHGSTEQLLARLVEDEQIDLNDLDDLHHKLAQPREGTKN